MPLVDKSPDASVALFTFGSRTNPDRPEPSYAFMNTVLRMKRMHKLSFDAHYFKAKKNDWYMSGMEGTESFEETVAVLREARSHYKSVIFTGNSMGGYAALAMGHLTGASGVLAFSPQTRFDDDFCRQKGERRWQDDYAEMRCAYPVDARSVRSIAEAHPGVPACLHVGGQNLQDMAYCHDLAGINEVSIVEHPQSGHDLVHDLRASGDLERLILAMIGR